MFNLNQIRDFDLMQNFELSTCIWRCVRCLAMNFLFCMYILLMRCCTSFSRILLLRFLSARLCNASYYLLHTYYVHIYVHIHICTYMYIII